MAAEFNVVSRPRAAAGATDERIEKMDQNLER